jgi:hypothetical protein
MNSKNSRHKRRHGHGRREVTTSEGVVAFDKQFHTRFLESSRVFEQSASITYTDLISNERTEHPSDDSCCQYDAYVQPTFSSQRARRDQRRIA